MPIYDYACGNCGEFTALKPLSQRHDAADCPDCGTGSARIIGGAPAISALSSAVNKARSLNERSAHEPRSSRGGHGMNCGCCSSAKSAGKTRRSADGAKSFAGARPWMISH